MDPIARTFGCDRVTHGYGIPHPLAVPNNDDPEAEYRVRKKTVTDALNDLLN